ncbi:hypothetical protein RBSH_01591 [Rhodopirellula baltica SH28]|uniref:Uncharacterized protein n=1 Tax=Rhodopirellula baltica SH28 TaxID=993517 RepID=K5DKB4_RHOBT|nr:MULTISPECIES: hypothetical protein [Rhodopirellula]EKK02898.1 hypothetical protein RBSH_01591 [Rhodopirellula baltica SH28]
MMKDAKQKDLLFKHFSAQGWFSIPEVPVYFSAGEHHKQKLITDIDVFGIRPNDNLRWEVLLGDCKTLKGQSPANRVIWLSGLMSNYNASEGYIVLQRRANQPIEADHKLFASSMSVFLLDEKDFKTFDHAMVFPDGTDTHSYGAADFEQLWSLRKRFPGLDPLVEFVSSGAWETAEFTHLLRRAIGEGKASAKEIDPAKQEHNAMVVNLASVFSVGLAACVGKVFQRHLHPSTEKELSDALKTVIWGGKEQYKFFSDLRKQLLEARGQQHVDDNNLSLPQWERFVQLSRKMLENPKAAFQVPQLLQLASIDLNFGREILPCFDNGQQQSLMLAMHVVDYVARSSGLPEEVRKVCESHFVKRLSRSAHEPRGTA